MKYTYQVWQNRTVDPTRSYVPATHGYVVGAIMEVIVTDSIDAPSFEVAAGSVQMIHELKLNVGDVLYLKDSTSWKAFEITRMMDRREILNWSPNAPRTRTRNRFSGDPGFMTPEEYETWRKTVACAEYETRRLRSLEHQANLKSDHVHSEGCRDPHGNTLRCGKPGTWPRKALEMTIQIAVDGTQIPEFLGQLGEVLSWWDDKYDITTKYV